MQGLASCCCLDELLVAEAMVWTRQAKQLCCGVFIPLSPAPDWPRSLIPHLLNNLAQEAPSDLLSLLHNKVEDCHQPHGQHPPPRLPELHLLVLQGEQMPPLPPSEGLPSWLEAPSHRYGQT